jgi:hypothetical protein
MGRIDDEVLREMERELDLEEQNRCESMKSKNRLAILENEVYSLLSSLFPPGIG